MLVISVVYRGCGIPVAWQMVVGNAKGSWKPYWLELLHSIEAGIEDDWFVIVTTDRGLDAKWLYQAIVELGWHPLMRINAQGYYQTATRMRSWADADASGLPSMSDLSSVDLSEPNLSANRTVTSKQILAPTRLLSCFRRGCLTLLASLIQGLPLPLGSFIPDFFPATG